MSFVNSTLLPRRVLSLKFRLSLSSFHLRSDILCNLLNQHTLYGIIMGIMEFIGVGAAGV